MASFRKIFRNMIDKGGVATIGVLCILLFKNGKLPSFMGPVAYGITAIGACGFLRYITVDVESSKCEELLRDLEKIKLMLEHKQRLDKEFEALCERITETKNMLQGWRRDSLCLEDRVVCIEQRLRSADGKVSENIGSFGKHGNENVQEQVERKTIPQENVEMSAKEMLKNEENELIFHQANEEKFEVEKISGELENIFVPSEENSYDKDFFKYLTEKLQNTIEQMVQQKEDMEKENMEMNEEKKRLLREKIAELKSQLLENREELYKQNMEKEHQAEAESVHQEKMEKEYQTETVSECRVKMEHRQENELEDKNQGGKEVSKLQIMMEKPQKENENKTQEKILKKQKENAEDKLKENIDNQGEGENKLEDKTQNVHEKVERNLDEKSETAQVGESEKLDEEMHN